MSKHTREDNPIERSVAASGPHHLGCRTRPRRCAPVTAVEVGAAVTGRHARCGRHLLRSPSRRHACVPAAPRAPNDPRDVRWTGGAQRDARLSRQPHAEWHAHRLPPTPIALGSNFQGTLPGALCVTNHITLHRLSEWARMGICERATPKDTRGRDSLQRREARSLLWCRNGRATGNLPGATADRALAWGDANAPLCMHGRVHQ